jgi:DNA-binding LacI/PurR family transcriptional regulator
VIGFDDIESAMLLGLSTVRQPLEDSGAEAARRLCALLRGEASGPLRQQLPLEVVHRSSTARLRGSGPSPAGARAGDAARMTEVGAAGRT